MTILRYLAILLFSLSAHAREWTSTDGKAIEADLIRVEGDNIVLLMKGKEFNIPLTRLVEADQEYAKEAMATAQREAEEAKMTLLGKKLVVGSVNHLEADLSREAAAALSSNALPPKKMKIQISLPEGFDPDAEQMVYWPVGGINNEAERRQGNFRRFEHMSDEALAAGYVVIAADTEHGNPRETTVGVQVGDHAFHTDVIERIAAEWPHFKTWRHACGGNSSGAKGSFFRIAQLLANDITVVGGFFGGCNECFASHSLEETGLKSRSLKPVKVWISTGKGDRLVPKEANARVVSQTDEAGYSKIRNEFFDGGHGLRNEEFAKALAWFKE